jgi:hypothetical protein
MLNGEINDQVYIDVLEISHLPQSVDVEGKSFFWISPPWADPPRLDPIEPVGPPDGSRLVV